jgi:hypothetical protein
VADLVRGEADEMTFFQANLLIFFIAGIWMKVVIFM